ncbi:Na(+)-translocating NADH-quinone reductase subunit C [Kaarinaea lacus]
MPNPTNDNPQGLLDKFRNLPNDSPQKIVIVTFILCLVCSVMVSSAAVLLRPLQLSEEQLSKRIEILKVAGLYSEDDNVNALFDHIEIRIIELETGEYVSDIDPDRFDYQQAANDPNTSVEIPDAKDIAKINRRAKYAPVYLVKDGDTVKNIILPIYGYGLWSTMHAFISLQNDGKTIEAISFYQHGETPGLGAEIANPQWQQRWNNKKIFSDSGDVKLRVIHGAVDSKSKNAAYEIDGISGATLTANGVSNLIRYWFGENGFGPYLAKYQKES